jgi:hypothetical protein
VTTADDDEKTVTGPTAPGRHSRDDAVTGIDAERARGRAAADRLPGGHTLPLGTRLRDYEITGLVGEGGFGIVYLAWDHSLQRRVAIKEYMPASMATRVSGSSAIVVKSERHLDTFRAGLKSFVNEARLLARFDHPSLVKVYRFWEENGTAYMAMPYYEGPTLKTALAALDGAPGEDELRAWLEPLLDALELMHSKQCFHRDIAPDNILLTAGGPLLLDFGAARRVIGDMTHALTVVLKPGYAPIEQYGDVATMAQGAWTDLYALASVVYFAITGRTPTSSVERLMDDRVEPLAAVARGRYSDELLRAVDAALAAGRPAAKRRRVPRAARPAGDAGAGRQRQRLGERGERLGHHPGAARDSGAHRAARSRCRRRDRAGAGPRTRARRRRDAGGARVEARPPARRRDRGGERRRRRRARGLRLAATEDHHAARSTAGVGSRAFDHDATGAANRRAAGRGERCSTGADRRRRRRRDDAGSTAAAEHRHHADEPAARERRRDAGVAGGRACAIDPTRDGRARHRERGAHGVGQRAAQPAAAPRSRRASQRQRRAAVAIGEQPVQ